MNNIDIHLTFKTDKETSEKLTYYAHSMQKTQPQLINEICKEFIKFIEEEARKQIQE